MKTRIYWFLFLSIMVLGLPGLNAEETILGRATDSSGAALEGASVSLQLNGRTIAETRTGASGEFTLSPRTAQPSDESYTLLVAVSGFSSASQTGKLSTLVGRRLVFVLKIAPYRESVEVQAAVPRSESTLDQSAIRESTAKDVGEALTALDGVWKIRKAGIANDLVIEGFQQNNINVLVDGSRTYGACPSQMDPPAAHVDLAEVDHVEVSKGAFDVENQGSLGAVVNIVTKTPRLGWSVKPSLSLGSFGYYNPSLTASYGNRRFRVLGGYSFRESDPYRDGAGHSFTDYAAYSATGKQQKSFSINTGWIDMQVSLSEKQQLSLEYSRQQAGLILYPYLTMDSNSDNADRGTVRYSTQDVSPLIRSLRVEGYFTQVRHFMSNSERTSAMMGNWSMAADAFSRTTGGHVEADLARDFTVGFESYDREWNMWGYMLMSGIMSASPAIPDVNTRSTGEFLKYHRALTDRLSLSGGLRYDHAQMRVESGQAPTNLYYQFHDTRRTSNSDNYPSGNLSLSLRLPKSMELFGGVGTTGRIPDAEERYFARSMGSGTTVGNPLLAVMRNTEVTAGWSVNRTHFYVRPTFFYSFLNNFILVNNQPQLNMTGGGGSMGAMMTVASASTVRSYANVDARICGGEVAYGVTLTKALSLNGGGSYERGTAATQPAINVMSHNLPEMPPLRVRSALRYTHGAAFAEIGSVAVWRQSLVDTDLSESPTAGYGLLNVKLGFTAKKLSASFSVDNLLDHFYYEYLSYFRDPFAAGVKVPEPGRNVFAQVRYSF